MLFKHKFTRMNDGRIDDFYVMDKKILGEGSYGTVKHAKHKDSNMTRAIKNIDMSSISDPKRFEDEISIQMELDHPHIVKLYETFKDAKYIYLVMELCTGGELFDRIVDEASTNPEGMAFGEKMAANYMSQIMGAITYLHTRSFVHRDIKPENFLMQSKDPNAPIKTIDFGLAKSFKAGEMMKTKAGTPYYVAPQVLSGSYDEKCDIWSCGVICYILLCGYPPFYGDNDGQILAAVKKGTFQFPSPDWDNVTREGKDLIKKMLTMDPKRRPAASEVLKHKWLTDHHNKPKSSTMPKDFVGKLKKFQSMGNVKKAALTLIAQQLKDEDIEELKSTFSALDSNQDGTLNIEEIRQGMERANVKIPAEFDSVVKGLDTDGSGSIDYTEFIAATLTTKQYLKKDVMWAAFRTFDTDGDEQITCKELASLLANPDNAMMEAMIKEVDINGDGVITFDEFCAMLEGK